MTGLKQNAIVSALNLRYPPETGEVGFSERPCSAGGFGVTGGGFRTGRSSGKATASTGAKQPPPVAPKPPTEQSPSKNSTPPISGWYL